MVLDSTVMNVSISEVVADLGTTVSGLQAAITFYTLTMAAFMMTGGKFGDKWGRLKAFRIGAVIYGIGSMITALSPNLGTLMFGWSLVEGLGAVLVIPAIAALIAMNYKGKDRVVGFTLIGAASGVAVAAGPLIGGYVTTYFSWRYVFAAETIIMAGILLYSFTIPNLEKIKSKVKIDFLSVLYSASGMAIFVFGILQSKTWGWIIPKGKPEINGNEIAPLGISIVAYLIMTGLVILYVFYRRQQSLAQKGKNPLLDVSMLNIKPLRAGLGVLGGQYLITAAIFFVIPIYLQMVLGYDALKTGIKIFPLSVAIVISSMVGSKLISKYSPKQIIRAGQVLLILGSVLLLGAIQPDIEGWLFGTSLFIVGLGLGLLVSQIGNVTMSAVVESKSSEVGGLQGTFQNLGASLGTALVGSVMIASLTTNFVQSISQNPAIPQSVKTSISDNSTAGVPIVSATDVENYAVEAGLSQSEAESISSDYKTSQVTSLKASMVFLTGLAVLTLLLSRNIPDKKLI
jgi:MFS family permease